MSRTSPGVRAGSILRLRLEYSRLPGTKTPQSLHSRDPHPHPPLFKGDAASSRAAASIFYDSRRVSCPPLRGVSFLEAGNPSSVPDPGSCALLLTAAQDCGEHLLGPRVALAVDRFAVNVVTQRPLVIAYVLFKRQRLSYPINVAATYKRENHRMYIDEARVK